jgi:hypothetical protein
MDVAILSFVVGLSSGKGTPFFSCLLFRPSKTMAKQKETSAPYVPHKLNEVETERMKAYLAVLSDRVEILGWLDNYAYVFPDWQKTVNEAQLAFIDKKQALTLPCEEEKEMLTKLNFFFSKMAYFSDLISTWYREMSGGKEFTEKMMWENFDVEIATLLPYITSFLYGNNIITFAMYTCVIIKIHIASPVESRQKLAATSPLHAFPTANGGEIFRYWTCRPSTYN